MYSPGEVSKLLDVPPSTVRRWSKHFRGFLSDGAATEGRRRVYSQEDFDLLSRVRDLAAQNISLNDIKGQLAQVIDHPPTEEQEQTALELPGVLREFRKVANRIKEQQAQIDALRGQLAQEQADREQLAARLEALEREQAERQRGLLARLFKRRE